MRITEYMIVEKEKSELVSRARLFHATMCIRSKEEKISVRKMPLQVTGLISESQFMQEIQNVHEGNESRE
jgi:hypothetical protein